MMIGVVDAVGSLKFAFFLINAGTLGYIFFFQDQGGVQIASE